MDTTKLTGTICFAYFANGNFLGWYADSFGSISETSPKLYGNDEKTIQIVSDNFRSKIAKIRETKFSDAKESATTFGEKLSLLIYSGSERIDVENVELRVVACPEYDGKNPNFDKQAYELLLEQRKQKMTQEGIYDIPAPSLERTNAVIAFNELNPMPKCDNWIYADYEKVKEWAANEPTEF